MTAGLLTYEQAVEYLGDLPLTTLKNLVKRKQIEHVRIGRSVAFKQEHLDAYIDAHTVKPHENPWGLTDGALRNLQASRVEKKAS